MILSNEGIRKALASGDLEIDPIPEADQYTTSSVDLLIGNEFRVWDEKRLKTPGFAPVLNLSEQDFQKTAQGFLINAQKETDGSIIVQPNTLMPLLAVTRERVHLKKDARLAARVEGRSSFARLGLLVHLTAPTIHSGWDGNITLEIINFGPFELRLTLCANIVETPA